MFKCTYCGDTGKLDKPKNEEEYNRIFDNYFDGGQFDGQQSHRMAIKKVEYDVIPCPHCEKGKEYAKSRR